MKKIHIRRMIQAGWAVLTNGYFYGFLKGSIYQGELKRVCVPGLNCYSCPGALGSCPLGSLQASLAAGGHISAYVTGFLFLMGAVFGRLICGFLCPFGLIQELLYKIPVRRKGKSLKRRRLPFDRYLRMIKYVLLVFFVLLLPAFAVSAAGVGAPWFCKYICPAGTLEGGWILALRVPYLRSSLGFLFGWKSLILIAVLTASVFLPRPFCRYLCPLGGIYGLFQKVSVYRYAVDPNACIHCGRCQAVCPMDVKTWENPNSIECVRCGDCKTACPTGAIHSGFFLKDGRICGEPLKKKTD